MLPDAKHMNMIDDVLYDAIDSAKSCTACELTEKIFSISGLPMHCPYHHYLIAAVLLTAAGLNAKKDPEKIKSELKKARDRAAAVPGGTCGEYGCCGAAISAGIFADIWLNTSPMSKKGWAEGNRFTAKALMNISEIQGPRCCKRVTYLTLESAVRDAHLLGADLGCLPNKIVCSHFNNNRECKGTDCPFFPIKHTAAV